MHKTLPLITLMALALAFALPHKAQAQAAPYTDVAAITGGATSVTWTAPAATYGALLSLETVNLTNGATLAVSHLVKYNSASYVTNTVETAAAGGTLLVYPERYIAPSYYCTNTTTGTVLSTTPVKPVWLNPGDRLVFTTSIAHGSTGYVVIRAGFPGN